MSKSSQQRINDTLQYIQNHIGATEHNEVTAALPPVGCFMYNQMSQNISLGFHILGSADQRHALRALLLCHQVFINDSDTKNRATQRARQAHANTAEGALQARIRSWFTTAGTSAANVCNLATANRVAMPTWDNSALDLERLVRGQMPSQRFNCYNAVVFWAFQGGAISLRWLWNHWATATTNALQAAALLPGPLSPLPGLDGMGEYPVPQGHVIVMQRPNNPLGHTVMSTGNGLCISQNNKAMLLTAANAELNAAKRAHAQAAINDCNSQKCHEIYIRFLVQQYYPPAQSYTPRHHPPFWLSYRAAFR